MSNSSSNIIYTAADIEKYLAGKLTPQQMHALEKAALDDPFLAEAIEGYEGMQGKDWEPHLQELKGRIDEKGKVAKVIPLHKSKNNWWKSVAALFILGLGIVTTYVLTTDKSISTETNPQIAQTSAVADDSLDAPADTVSSTTSLNPSASVSASDLAAKKQPVSGKTTVDNLFPDSTTRLTKDMAAKTEGSARVNESKAKTSVSPSAKTGNPTVAEETSRSVKTEPANVAAGFDDASESRETLAANAKKVQAANNYFTAQVVGPGNQPLPFSNITIKKENFGTYADVKGMLRLMSADSVLNIEVKSAGYQPKTFTLFSNKPQTKLVLQEDEGLDRGKNVSGRAAPAANQKYSNARLYSDLELNVEPADGWENYNKYVANNLDVRGNILNNNQRVEVELTFDVNTDGTITNLKITRSPGAVYNEAARRLLAEGPPWKIKKGKAISEGLPNSATVKLQF